MDYTEFNEEARTAHVKAQLANYESQHFQQGLLAEEADAAAQSVADDDPDGEARRKGFQDAAKLHRANVREAEARCDVYRAALAVIDGGKSKGHAAKA